METNSITLDNKQYAVELIKGVVVGKDKGYETRVYGGGGGGYNYQGTGGNTSVSISSQTYIHDKIFLDLGNGKQKLIELTDWDIACLPGHEIVVIRLSKISNSKYKTVLVQNRTTNETKTFNFESNYELLINIPKVLYSIYIGILTLLSIFFFIRIFYQLFDYGNFYITICYFLIVAGLLFYENKKLKKRLKATREELKKIAESL